METTSKLQRMSGVELGGEYLNVVAGMVVTEAEVDSNAGLGDVMKVQVQLGSVTPQYVLSTY